MKFDLITIKAAPSAHKKYKYIMKREMLLMYNRCSNCYARILKGRISLLYNAIKNIRKTAGN